MLAIVLAAGESARMGMPKALLKLPSGRTLLEDQCIRLLAAGCRRIIVVVGADAKKFKVQSSKFKDKKLKIQLLYNPNWRLGQFSSIQAALKAVSSEQFPPEAGPPLAEAVSKRQSYKASSFYSVLPIDVPCVLSKTIKMLIEKAKLLRTAVAVVPRYKGRNGHPVILLPKIVRKILRLDPKSPSSRLDYILKKTRGVIYVDTDDPAVVRNVNTPGDWNTAISKSKFPATKALAGPPSFSGGQ